ncbi:cytochrome c oxidase subunit 3 [Paenibacillus sp. MAHUQ-46]|uniref:Cytochrome c oxidase subunit 3 n=1 Tax=Paenibacillus roseus TaxID=2798579 RepID=A0A934IV38_9BACL|nr:cytochrome c oxidase subunit 3 [Paenibacillus roseus]MBJ6359882.1 cytochrome c oxidase subunit 3 [Paenibacillus roseus]
MKINKFHPFHLVDPSPWPIFASFSAFFMLVGAVMYMHAYSGGFFLLVTGALILAYSFIVWWRDVIREGTFYGLHTKAVQTGLRYGVILFILSEVMLFVAIFWAFFHSSLAPTIEIGGVWPPAGIEVINPWEIPFLNTLLLLTSGASVTWAHHALLSDKNDEAFRALIVTVVLAIIFTGFQAFEYFEAPFTIASGIFGSTFFLSTGFHGFHVIIGTIFLFVCTIRVYLGHFSKGHHFGFEAAAWYWHMVDVVWLFLFVCVYYWGGA